MNPETVLIITTIVTGIVLFLQGGFFRLIKSNDVKLLAQSVACLILSGVGVYVGAVSLSLLKQEFVLSLFAAFAQVLVQAASAVGIMTAVQSRGQKKPSNKPDFRLQ